MGYNTITVAPSSTTGLGVQFKNVGDEGAAIKIKNLVKVSNPKGGASIDGSVDQIWTFDGYSWTKYYFYSGRGQTKWLKTPVEGKPDAASETEDTIANGQSFFFVRSNGGVIGDSVTLAGEVVPLASKPEYPVVPSSTTAMAYPWPQPLKIKAFTQFNDNPKGGASIDGSVDQIWTFDGYNWTKYYFYSGRGQTKWLKTPVEGKPDAALETEDEISVGQAFFFVRSNGGAANDKIVFKQL